MEPAEPEIQSISGTLTLLWTLEIAEVDSVHSLPDTWIMPCWNPSATCADFHESDQEYFPLPEINTDDLLTYQ
jgi:hypothetical protein